MSIFKLDNYSIILLLFYVSPFNSFRKFFLTYLPVALRTNATISVFHFCNQRKHFSLWHVKVS